MNEILEATILPFKKLGKPTHSHIVPLTRDGERRIRHWNPFGNEEGRLKKLLKRLKIIPYNIRGE